MIGFLLHLLSAALGLVIWWLLFEKQGSLPPTPNPIVFSRSPPKRSVPQNTASVQAVVDEIVETSDEQKVDASKCPAAALHEGHLDPSKATSGGKCIFAASSRAKEQATEEARKFHSLNVLNADELRSFDGTSGKPVYISVKGVVFDVSVHDFAVSCCLAKSSLIELHLHVRSWRSFTYACRSRHHSRASFGNCEWPTSSCHCSNLRPSCLPEL